MTDPVAIASAVDKAKDTDKDPVFKTNAREITEDRSVS